MMSARLLAQAGISVALMERGELGREASWAGGGILSPLYPWRVPEELLMLSLWSQKRYSQLTDELLQESEIDAELLPSGMLIPEEHEIELAQRWAKRWNYPVEILTQQEVQQKVSVFSPETEKSLWLPGISQIRNPRLVKALRQSLKHYGVTVFEHEEVLSVLTEHGRAAGVQTASHQLHAEQFLIASGAWTGVLMEKMQLSVPVEPVRGQILLFNCEPGLLSSIILKEGLYLIPRRDGHVLAGSTLERVGFDTGTTEAALQLLQANAYKLIPALKKCNIERHWAGLRPGSPRGIPLIDRHPHLENLYIAAGHFRNGINTAPATAHLIRDMMLGREPILPPENYSLKRFLAG